MFWKTFFLAVLVTIFAPGIGAHQYCTTKNYTDNGSVVCFILIGTNYTFEETEKRCNTLNAKLPSCKEVISIYKNAEIPKDVSDVWIERFFGDKAFWKKSNYFNSPECFANHGTEFASGLCKKTLKLSVNDSKSDSCPNGTYYYPLDFNLNETNFSCKHCNPLCSQCTDAGLDQKECHECKHYRENGVCVKECSGEFYANVTSKTCNLCHSICQGCTGPSEGDCKSCKNYKLQMDNTIKCLDECPDHFYENEATRECEPCHEQCNGCHGPTDEDCFECENFKVIQDNNNTLSVQCVGKCPKHIPHIDASEKSCINMHRPWIISGAVAGVLVLVIGLACYIIKKKMKPQGIDSMEMFSNRLREMLSFESDFEKSEPN